MRLTPTARFGLAAASVYVALSWAFRFPTAHGAHNASLVYPLDTFSMYAEEAPERVGAFVVRVEGGSTEPLGAFSALECETREGAPFLRADGSYDVACESDGEHIEYLDADLGAYLRAHPGTGPLEVEIVRRTWTTPRDGPLAAPIDCVLARCRAAR